MLFGGQRKNDSSFAVPLDFYTFHCVYLSSKSILICLFNLTQYFSQFHSD